MRRLVIGTLIAVICLVACKRDTKPVQQTPDTVLKGNVDPNITFYTRLIGQNPNEDSLYYLRAEAYYKSEGYDEAITDLQRAISIDTTHPDYFHLLADCYLDYFKSYPAIQTMEEARRRWPERIPTLLKLSEFYLIVKKHGEAMKVVQDVMRLDPDNAEGYFMAAVISKDKGEIPLAIKNMERSVALNPDNLDAWVILGNLLSGKNDQVAVKYYQNALRIDSTSLEAWDGIATFYHKAGRLKEAEDTYKSMVSRNPSRPETYFDLTMLYLEQNKMEEAKKHINMAIDQDPLYFKAIYYRGHIAEKEGDLQAARTDYDQASRMVTDYAEAKEALKRVDELIKKKENAKK